MTIVLGFTCKTGIVLACDSQLSYKEITHKQTGVGKLARVPFAGGAVLLAKAGSFDLTSYFHERFEARSREVQISNPRVPADLAEATMKEVRSKLVDALTPEQPTSDRIQGHIAGYPYEVMLAYYCDGKPHIFASASYAGLAIRQTHQFAAIGCGANLASYVLSGINTSVLEVRHAMALAAYTVEMCKKHDSACGGVTQVATISSQDGCCSILPSAETLAYANTAHLVSDAAGYEILKQLKETHNTIAPYYAPKHRKIK